MLAFTVSCSDSPSAPQEPSGPQPGDATAQVVSNSSRIGFKGSEDLGGGISVIWQWVFFLPLAYLVGPVLGFGLVSVWIVNGVYRSGQAINCMTQWAGRKWTHVKI